MPAAFTSYNDKPENILKVVYSMFKSKTCTYLYLICILGHNMLSAP